MKMPLKLAAIRKLTQILEQTEFEAHPPGLTLDFTGRVHRGRALFGHETDGYYLNLIDSPRQDPGVTAGDKQARRSAWEIYLQIVNPDRGDFSSDIYDEIQFMSAAAEKQLSRCVKMDDRKGKPLYPDDYRLGPQLSSYVVSVEVGPSLVRPPEPEARAHAYSFQSIVIEMASLVGLPYVEIED